MLNAHALTPPTTSLTALEIANAFIAQMHAGDSSDEIERVRAVVLLAGQHLADLGCAGHWPAFDGATFFEQIAFLERHERLGYALILVGLFGWLAASDLVLVEEALAIIGDIQHSAPKSPLADELCAAAERMLLG